jgi:putative phosphoesterase
MSAQTPSPTRVGLISDTHNRLDPRVFDALDGVDFILHAGDIGGPDVLWKLEGIAPVTAVLGNTDFEVPGYRLGQQARIRIAGKEFLVIHDLRRLGPVPPGVDVVVHGHTHVPAAEKLADALLVNPGPARRPKKGLSRTVGVLTIDGDRVEAEIIPLDRFGPKT